jgi:putative PIN family toxin of toxin-antitoxin system
MKPLVVIDTSVWIHYLIRPGAAVRRIVEELWLGDALTVVSAPELVEELEGVLARPAMRELVPEEAGLVLLELIRERVEMLPELGEIPALTRDPKDDMFVACAVLAGAGFLISLDRDVLAVGELEGVRMVTPVGFVEINSGDPVS